MLSLKYQLDIWERIQLDNDTGQKMNEEIMIEENEQIARKYVKLWVNNID